MATIEFLQQEWINDGDFIGAGTADGIKAGDAVVIRYSDTNKLRRIFLSATENRPEDGIVHISQPLGTAVLGAEIDDEIQFRHEKGTRSAIIERIERGVN